MSAITATVQLRRDTAANWTANNPTLLAGEVGIETDTRRMKFGNGTQTWTALAYAQGTAAQSNTGDFDAAGSAASAQAAAIAAAASDATTKANAAQAAAIAASQPLDADLTSYANAADAAARRALIGAGIGNGNMVAANNLSDLTNVATARTNLGLGTNALVNGAPSYITYSGGSVATTSTSFADVHSSAGWSGLAPGMYLGEFYILYDAAATTTGARFGLNGTVTQDYLTIFVGYSTLAGDRSSAQTGTFDGGAAAPSSTVTSGNSAVVQFTVNVTVTGNIVLRFATEVGGSAITVTSVIGFIRRVA